MKTASKKTASKKTTKKPRTKRPKPITVVDPTAEWWSAFEHLVSKAADSQVPDMAIKLEMFRTAAANEQRLVLNFRRANSPFYPGDTLYEPRAGGSKPATYPLGGHGSAADLLAMLKGARRLAWHLGLTQLANVLKDAACLCPGGPPIEHGVLDRCINGVLKDLQKANDNVDAFVHAVETTYRGIPRMPNGPVKMTGSYVGEFKLEPGTPVYIDGKLLGTVSQPPPPSPPIDPTCQWRSRDGTVHEMSKMSISHMQNCRRMIDRTIAAAFNKDPLKYVDDVRPHLPPWLLEREVGDKGIKAFALRRALANNVAYASLGKHINARGYVDPTRVRFDLNAKSFTVEACID